MPVAYAGPSREGLMRSCVKFSVSSGDPISSSNTLTHAWWDWIPRSSRNIRTLRPFGAFGILRRIGKTIGALSHCLRSIGCRVIAFALLVTSRIVLVLILLLRSAVVLVLILVLVLVLVLSLVLLFFNRSFSRCFHGRHLGINSSNLTLLLTVGVLFPKVLEFALLIL